MIRAYDWLQQPHSGTLYQTLFFAQHIKFQYPPTALLPLAAMRALRHWPTDNALNAINWFLFALMVLSVVTFALILARRSAVVPSETWLPVAAVAIVMLLAAAAFYPELFSYVLGQAQTWINLLFVWACLCWIYDRRLLAGMLIGAICLVKPQFAAFLLWGVLRRQWSFLVGWCALVLPALAISIALFGVANHLDYFSELLFLSRHGEAYHANQSVNGLLNRMLFNGDGMNWSGTDFPPYNVVVYLGTLLSSLALILSALLVRGRRHDESGLFDFMTAALTFTIASPIAWEHHYGILPPILIGLLFALLTAPRTVRSFSLWMTLGIAYVLSANDFPITNLTATTPFNFLQSYVLFGGLAVLWLLYQVETPVWLHQRASLWRPVETPAATLEPNSASDTPAAFGTFGGKL